MERKVDERIKNIKIYVDGRSAEIQKKLFELGAEWGAGGQRVDYTDTPFLYVDNHGNLRKSYNMRVFIEDKGKELSAQEVLSLIPKKEPTFEPYQKVLCRDGNERWKPNLYGYYDEGSPLYPHCCIGEHYKCCIAYEGNEHLVGTTDNPSK